MERIEGVERIENIEGERDRDRDTKSVVSLDTQWIHDFEEYDEFYKDNVHTIELHILYIDETKTLVDYIKEPYSIQENILTKEQLIYTIKKHIIYHNQKYRLLSVLQYNFCIENEDVVDFIKNVGVGVGVDGKTHDNTIHPSLYEVYFTRHTGIEDIKWKPTIPFFKNVNALYIIYYKNGNGHGNTGKTKRYEKANQNTTRRIRISPNRKFGVGNGGVNGVGTGGGTSGGTSGSRKTKHAKTYKKYT